MQACNIRSYHVHMFFIDGSHWNPRKVVQPIQNWWMMSVQTALPTTFQFVLVVECTTTAVSQLVCKLSNVSEDI